MSHVVSLKNFGGLYPRLAPHLSPENAASKAENVKLSGGRLEAFQVPLPLGVAPPDTRSFHLWGCEPVYFNCPTQALDYLPDYGRLYYCGPAGAGVMSAGGRFPPLGLPAPTIPLEVTAIETAGEDADARSYVYTWVNEFEEESAPSPPSRQVTVKDGTPVRLRGFEAPPEGRGLKALRLYRSATGYRTGAEQQQEELTDYFMVQEYPLTTGDVTENKSVLRLGFVLLTREARPAPEGLERMIHLVGTGRLAGAKDNKIYFSEVYEPWNWPSRYDMTLPERVINIGSVGGAVLATTEGYGYVIAAPTEPEANKTVRRSPWPEPDLGCGRPRSAAATPYGLVYAGRPGLVLLKPDGGLETITAPWFTDTEWRRLRPETAKLVFFRGSLVIALQGETYLLDLANKNLSTLAIRPDDLLVSGNGELIYLENGTLYQFDAGAHRLPYVWESRDLGLATPSCARVRTDGITFRLSSGAADHPYVKAVLDDKPFHLKRLGRRKFWRVGFSGLGRVERCDIGWTFAELGDEV